MGLMHNREEGRLVLLLKYGKDIVERYLVIIKFCFHNN